MPFTITIRRSFSAGHQLRLADGSLEPLHGHNWRIRLVVERLDADLDRIGCVHDFHDLARRLDEVVGPLDHRHLNELPAFAELSPSTENLARFLAEGLDMPPGVRVVEVEVWETDDCSATYRPSR